MPTDQTIQTKLFNRLLDNGLSFVLIGIVAYALYGEVKDLKKEMITLRERDRSCYIEQRDILRDQIDKNNLAVETLKNSIYAVLNDRKRRRL